MKLFQSLGFRLFLLIFAVLVLVFSFHTYMSIQLQAQQSMHHIKLCARRISDLVKSSTHYSMLINRKQDIKNIVTTVGQEPDIENLSIINHDGEYIYTSNPLDEHKIVSKQSRVCIQCHSGKKPAVSISKKLNIIGSPEGYRIAELTRPIFNEPSCYNAACHAHPKGQKVLGLMNIQISLKDIDNATHRSISILIFLSFISVVIIIFILWLFIRREVITPVQILHKGTREIGHGNLNYTISFPSKTEIGDLANSFNKMTRRLRDAQKEITQWSRTLESRVKEKSQELENAQQQMMQVEKMASLGKLSATVAHEINNPLAGILNYTKLIEKRIQKSALPEETQKNVLEELGIIASEIKRLGNIVKNLLTFARGSGEELTENDINKIVKKSLLLVNHHFQMHNITLETRYCSKACIVKCNPDHLTQALIAIYVNAVEAMLNNSDNEGGTLRVEVWKLDEEKRVQIRISDTGIGISEEDLPHIFEPFYSTKNKTSGVGLGLSVVYGIIKNHGGTIRVQSKVGEGSTFFIEFSSI